MNSILAFAGFVLSLLGYLLIARKAGKIKVTHPDQFFLSKSEHDSDQFAASQISYALQMATVYPFFIFAFSGTWWLALWNTIFYAVGIVLLYALLPRFMTEHSELVGSSKTIHAFIGNLHNTPRLRQFTALMSIIGFTGLASFEIVWGARILRVLFNGNSSIYYLAIAILAFYLILYLWLGGQRGTINTGQIQLVVAYVGIHLAVAWLVLQPAVLLSKMDAGIMATLILLNGFVMLFYRLQLMRNPQISKTTRVLNIFTIASLTCMLLAILAMPQFFSLNSLSWKAIDYSSSGFWWQLSSFALLPLFFQFVDMTNWQRMASLTGQDNRMLLARVHKGLTQYLIESPLSWFLPVLLGLGAVLLIGANLQGDPWDGFVNKIIATPGILGTLLSIFFVCGIGAVFLSTADGLLSAIGYSYTYDFHKRTRNMVDRTKTSGWKPDDVKYVVGTGRVAMAIFLAIVICIFVTADIFSNKGDTILGIFLAFFSPMVSFAPALLIPAITGRVTSGIVAWAAIGFGAMAGIVTGIISVFEGGIWQWLSTDVAFAVSWSIYLLGFAFYRRKTMKNE